MTEILANGYAAGSRAKWVYVWLTLALVSAGLIFLFQRGRQLHRTGWTGMAFGFPRGWSTGLGEAVDYYLGYISFSPVPTHRPGVVLEVVPGTPAHRAGLRPGDRILSLAGVPLADLEQLRTWMTSLNRGQKLAIRYWRDGAEHTVMLQMASPFAARAFVVQLISGVVTFLGFFLVGLYVMGKRPRDPAARVFFFLCMTGAVAFYFGPARVLMQHPLGLAARSVAYVVPFLVYLALITLFLHFVLVFPRPRRWVTARPYGVYLLYFPLFLSVVFRVAAAHMRQFPAGLIYFAVAITAIPLLVYPVFSILIALRAYRDGTAAEKRQIRWPLWGILVTLVLTWLLPLALMAVHALIGGPRIADTLAFTSLWPLAHLLIPFAFAMAIVKHRLFEIDILFHATVVYSVLVFILLGMYGALAAGLGHLLLRRMGVAEAWGHILATLLVGVSILPLRDRIRAWADRWLLPRPPDHGQVLQVLDQRHAQAANLADYVQDVVEQVQAVLASRAVALFLRVEGDPVYRVRAAVGLPDAAVQQVRFDPLHPLVRLLQSTAVETLSGQPRAVRDALRRVRAAWLVPVWVRDRMVGFMTLGRKLTGKGFTASDRRFMTAVVEILARGLQRIAERQREREYGEALTIQKKLLPREIPRIPGFQIAGAWQPARVVSGDYYDVLQLGPERLGLCIADVCGKGLPAALLMSNLQAGVRSAATADTPPNELCNRVNDLLYANTDSNKFANFFYAVLYGPERRLVYTNAGHPPPLLLHADGTLLRLTGQDPVLGVFPRWQYRSRELVLAPEDLLFLYTDGLLEARAANGEEFGEARLMETLRRYHWLPTDALLHKVIQTVTTHTGGPLQDDLTLLVVRVRGV